MLGSSITSMVGGCKTYIHSYIHAHIHTYIHVRTLLLFWSSVWSSSWILPATSARVWSCELSVFYHIYMCFWTYVYRRCCSKFTRKHSTYACVLCYRIINQHLKYTYLVFELNCIFIVTFGTSTCDVDFNRAIRMWL